MVPLPGIVEVRCAGCGETLDVEHGLTEFACPDCGTAQALPAELMPRRPRRALPLPGRGAPFAATPSRVSCGGCGAVLSVPHGHGHFACPLCGAELAASPAAAVSVIAPPAAVPIIPRRPAQPSEVLAGPSSRSIHAGHSQKPIYSEKKHEQRPRHFIGEESFTTFRAETGREPPVVGRLQNGPDNSSSHREESHNESLDGSISRPSKKRYIFAASPESFRARKVQEEDPNHAFHASDAQGMSSNSSIHKDKAEGLPNDTTIRHSMQKTVHLIVPSSIELEQRKSHNHVGDVQQAGVIPNNVGHADKVQVQIATKATENNKKSSKYSKGNQKTKNKTVLNSSNEFRHLRRSKRLAKGSPDQVEPEPIQKIDASQNQNQSEAPSTERTLVDADPSSPVGYRFRHGGSSELDDVSTTTPPPLNHDASHARGTEIALADPHPSSPVRFRFPHARSNELDDVDATTSDTLNHIEPQADEFRHIQIYSPDTRWALPVPSFNSWHEHEILPDSFNGINQLDRGHEEVLSNPSETHNQDMDWQLAQGTRSDKNRSGHVQLKPSDKNLSKEGMLKRNGFTCSSSNDAEYPEDRTCSEIRLQSSHLASSLPFPAVTTLPTTMTPSSRENLPHNGSSPSLLHQQTPSPQYIQETHRRDDPPGSVSNPSKKRRGRAPEKLMEPRKEADRPVLTPIGSDWGVQPPCPKVANTLSLLIKQNYPGTYLSVDSSKNGQPCEHVVYHWHQCPTDIKSNILDEFLKRYKWSPGQEEECRKIFDRKAVRQLFNLFCYEKQRVREVLASKKIKKSLVHRAGGEMEQEDGREDLEAHQGDELFVVPEYDDPLKWKPFVPRWMKPKWWEMLCDHWAKDEVMKVSYQKRKNRNSGKSPCNTVASQSVPVHLQLDSTNRHRKRAGGAQVGSHPLQGEVGTLKCGNYCGAVGVLKEAQNETLSKSSAGCVSKQGQQPMFTKEQVQEMINQALQGLNQEWEKKFLSLEQKMPSMSSAYIVPDGSKVLSGVSKSKQCQLAREDTLGSVDGENDPAARDHADNHDEEEHSS